MLDPMYDDVQKEIGKIVKFIKEEIEKGEFQGCVVGLSGGLDSSVCAALAAKALGRENVLGTIMPALDSDPQDELDAYALADNIGIHTVVKPIYWLQEFFPTEKRDFEKEVKPYLVKPTKLVPPYIELPYVMKLRARMLTLSYYAKKLNYFQCQTLERTEWLLGWFDPFGDAAGDIAPIFHLYKSQVREIGKELVLPDCVLNRAPSSGNYPLTDEEELGMKLEDVDQILVGMRNGWSDKTIKEVTGISLDIIDQIDTMTEFSQVKRDMPICLNRSTGMQ